MARSILGIRGLAQDVCFLRYFGYEMDAARASREPELRQSRDIRLVRVWQGSTRRRSFVGCIDLTLRIKTPLAPGGLKCGLAKDCALTAIAIGEVGDRKVVVNEGSNTGPHRVRLPVTYRKLELPVWSLTNH